MNLEEVLPALRRGKKIRRVDKDWQNDFGYVFYRHKEFELLYSKSEGEDHLYSFDETDLFFNDWEVVEEKKKVKLRDLTPEQIKKWKLKECSDTDCNKCLYAICWFYHKNFYSDEFLDQEIEIDE